MEEPSNTIKKNILDLQYNKYLQYFNTIIVLLFTYFIGLIIAFLTDQIDFSIPSNVYLLSSGSSLFFIILVLLLLRFKYKMNQIIEEVKQLKI